MSQWICFTFLPKICGVFVQGICNCSKVQGQRLVAGSVHQHGLWAEVSGTFSILSNRRIMLKWFSFFQSYSCGVTDFVCRGGRGDRTGRYGNSNNNHNFRDMDYRGYEQEDEDRQTDELFACDDQLSDGSDFHERSIFPLRGDGSRDPEDEDKCGLWPPCHQPQPSLTSSSRPFLLKMEKQPRFEQPVRTSLLERPLRKNGVGFTDSTAPVLGNRDSSWGAGGIHSDGMEFHAARQQAEGSFSRDPAKRRVSCK